MKGKIFGTLFALPFFAVGAWMLWSISGSLYDAWRMDSWVQVPARVTSGGYKTHSGDDSDTYEAYARYTYMYEGREYHGNRVSLSSGGDNIGDYQQDIGRNLQRAIGDSILVYVNPDKPNDSIIDRGLRWGLLGFKSIFVFVFGGVGLGAIILIWRAPREKDKSLPEYQASPWLLNDDWQTESIRSSSKTAMYGAWAFAGLWNLISAPLPFLLYEEVLEKQNYIALIGLLFPIVGVGLLVWAVRRTLEWRRFGPAPVTLDPFPGSIGGHVGGTIDLAMPFAAAAQFQVTLTNLHHYYSGSGKNRSRKESAIWQDKLVAHAEPGGKGTRLTFRFDVPEEQKPSDVEHDDSYYTWRLNVHAELEGADLDRDYDIPVYATATQSRRLSDRAVAKSRAEQDKIDDKAVGNIVNLQFDASGRRMLYPMFRYVGSAIGGFLVGAIFAGVGWWLVVNEGERLFGSIFGGMGALIAIFCAYLMLNSLEVSRDGMSIRTVRRVLGIPVSRKQMHQGSFERFKKKSTMRTQSGGKHVIYYSVFAVDRQGNKFVVGEGFKGESEANAAIRLISREFGLNERKSGRGDRGDDELLGPEVLT